MGRALRLLLLFDLSRVSQNCLDPAERTFLRHYTTVGNPRGLYG